MGEATDEGEERAFAKLLAFLKRVPATEDWFGTGTFDDGNWWIKFGIDTDHDLAWSTVQEMGHVLNLVSLEEQLPAVFMPVSPPPYLNGGPEYLSWVIESKSPDFTPDKACEWLESRMPRPVEDESLWPVNQLDDEEEDE